MSLQTIIDFKDYLSIVIDQGDSIHPTTLSSLNLLINKYNDNKLDTDSKYFDYNAYMNNSSEEEYDDCPCYGLDNCTCKNDNDNCKFCMNKDGECVRCNICYKSIEDNCECYEESDTEDEDNNNLEDTFNIINESFELNNFKLYSNNEKLINYKNWYQNINVF